MAGAALYFCSCPSPLLQDNRLYFPVNGVLTRRSQQRKTDNYFFQKSLGKNNNDFLLYNLGGMGIRLLFLLIVVIIVIKFLNIDEYAFIFLFFIFYFISLVFEVNYFRKKAKEQGKSK